VNIETSDGDDTLVLDLSNSPSSPLPRINGGDGIDTLRVIGGDMHEGYRKNFEHYESSPAAVSQAQAESPVSPAPEETMAALVQARKTAAAKLTPAQARKQKLLLAKQRKAKLLKLKQLKLKQAKLAAKKAELTQKRAELAEKRAELAERRAEARRQEN
jgi:conjugal transfer/entry exclusion protein